MPAHSVSDFSERISLKVRINTELIPYLAQLAVTFSLSVPKTIVRLIEEFIPDDESDFELNYLGDTYFLCNDPTQKNASKQFQLYLLPDTYDQITQCAAFHHVFKNIVVSSLILDGLQEYLDFP